MALSQFSKQTPYTLLNTGSGNANQDGSNNLGFVAINTNFWWQTGAYGPAGVAGHNTEVSWKHISGAGYFCGLGTTTTPYTRASIEFALHNLGSTWYAYELGVRKGNCGAVNNGDRCTVRAGQDGVVEYLINDVVMYTSLVAPASVQAMALRPNISAGYYSSWDENFETQPQSLGSAQIQQGTMSDMAAISTGGGSVVGIPTEGQLFPRLTGVSSGGGALSNSRLANAILTREPLIYHRFEENAGASTSVDLMGRVNGTFENVSLEQPSLIVSDTEANRAASFNGSSSRITMGAPVSLQLQSFTLFMLVKTPSDFSSHWRLFDYDSSDSWSFGRGYHWSIGTDGKVTLSIGNGGAYNGAASGVLSALTTYALAATYDGTTQKVFVNGALAGSQALAGPVSYTNASLAALGYVYFAGNLIRWGKGIYDEFAVFPYVMSDAGLLELYKKAFNLP